MAWEQAQPEPFEDCSPAVRRGCGAKIEVAMMSRWRIHVVAPGAVAEALAHRVPSLAGRPVVVEDEARRHVCCASPSALSTGVVRGMPMAQALACCPEMQVVPYLPAPRDALREMLVVAFEDGTPFAGHDEVGLAVWEPGPPRALATQIEAWFRRALGVEAHAATAAESLAARVAAFCRETVPSVLLPGEERAGLAPAPLAGLPWLPRRGVNTLAHQWAVFTVGDLVELPGALALKLLGRDGVDLHAVARGGRRDAPADAQARVALSPPSNDAAGSRRALLDAVDRAWHTLSARGLGARRLEVRLWRAGGAPTRRAAMFDPEAEDPMTLGVEACRLLERLSSRGAVNSVGVRLWGGSPAGMQLALFPQRQAFRIGRLGDALARLRGRYGQACIRRGSTIGLSR